MERCGRRRTPALLAASSAGLRSGFTEDISARRLFQNKVKGISNQAEQNHVMSLFGSRKGYLGQQSIYLIFIFISEYVEFQYSLKNSSNKHLLARIRKQKSIIFNGHNLQLEFFPSE